MSCIFLLALINSIKIGSFRETLKQCSGNSYCVHRFPFVLRTWPSFKKCLFAEEFQVTIIGDDFSLKRGHLSPSVLRWRCTSGTRRPAVASMDMFDICVVPWPMVRCKIYIHFHAHSLLFSWSTFRARTAPSHMHVVIQNENEAAARASSMMVTYLGLMVRRY